MLARRVSVDPAERETWSRLIEERLSELDLWQGAALVHTYVGAVQVEVATRGIVERALREGKTVVCPRVRWKPRGLNPSRFARSTISWRARAGSGKPDPARANLVEEAELDLVLVPGIAFDRRGWRIGFGAGLYDRFLAGAAAPSVALAFSSQILDSLPVEPHDEPVDWIVTEGETIACRAIREQSEREAIR